MFHKTHKTRKTHKIFPCPLGLKCNPLGFGMAQEVQARDECRPVALVTRRPKVSVQGHLLAGSLRCPIACWRLTVTNALTRLAILSKKEGTEEETSNIREMMAQHADGAPGPEEAENHKEELNCTLAFELGAEIRKQVQPSSRLRTGDDAV